MGSKNGAGAKIDDRKAAAPAEQEYFIQPTLARYIDRKDLEKLLSKTFKKVITAYHHNDVFRYTASRELNSRELEYVSPRFQLDSSE